MANQYYQSIIKKIENKYGKIKRIGSGYTLYYIPAIDIIVYFRYSKISKASKNVLKAFYGLRKEDILLMQRKKSFICLITNDESKNIFIPFQPYETYFSETEPSGDGQYKTLSFFKPTGSEIYFANIGKFNAESYFNLDDILNISQIKISLPELSHSQIQSLIGSIGIKKGYKIWFPDNDKQKIDKSIVDYTKVIEKLLLLIMKICINGTSTYMGSIIRKKIYIYNDRTSKKIGFNPILAATNCRTVY